MNRRLARKRAVSVLVSATFGAALVALPMAPATAADATLASAGGVITYTAGAGEGNDLSVSVSGANYTFDDTSANNVDSATTPCTVSAGVGSCPTAGVTKIVVNLGDMNDTVTVSSGVTDPAEVHGGDGVDVMAINSVDMNDVLYGDAGNDVMDTGAGSGDDQLFGGDGSDTLWALAGNDSVNGDAGNDSLDGGDGNDTLNGGPGVDDLNGWAGNDRLIGGTGSDDMSGGDDIDSADYSARASAVTVDIDDVADDGGAGEDDNVGPDVENVIGGAGNDTITGDADANALYGGPGADQLRGAAGHDALLGQGGSDALAGQAGNDALYGGRGFDTLAGMAGADTLFGGARADTMSGGAAGDRLYGGVGYDTMRGNYGNDFLKSQDTFRDLVYAGAGTDTVNKDWRDRVFGAETVF